MKRTKRGFKLEIPENPSPEMQEVLDWYIQNFQFIPNLTRVMSEAPALVRSYWQTQLNLMEKGTLTPEENNVVQMSIAVENKCRYCASGHILAGRMVFGSSEEVMAGIIAESHLPEEKLNALRDFALAVYEGKGNVSEASFSKFKEAGYSNSQALDVVTNISTKVMSNFTNQLTNNELDEILEPLAGELTY